MTCISQGTHILFSYSLSGNFGEVVSVELAMDRTVSLHILGVIALEEFSVMWYFDFFFVIISRLIFQKDMDMCNSRQEGMLKRHYYTWMV